MARRAGAVARLVVVTAALGAAVALVALAGAEALGMAIASQTSERPAKSMRAPAALLALGAELVGAALLVGVGAGRRGEEA